MNMRALAAASILIVGAVVAPVVVAPVAASTTTGALTVMLTTPDKVKLPMAKVPVTLFDAYLNPLRHGVTNSLGRATFSSVPAGKYYRVKADPGASDIYLSYELINVTVTAGSHEYVVAVVRHGATISGRVTGPSGGPLGNRYVIARNRGSLAAYTTTTNSSGGYVLTGLPTGSYSVQFNARPQLFESHQPAGAPIESVAENPFGWSLWGDEPAQPGLVHYLWVVEERGPVAESRITGVDGSVPNGVKLTGIVQPQSGIDFRGAEVYLGTRTASIEFAGQVDATGTKFEVILQPGGYNIGITGVTATGEKVEFWYTSDTTEPSHLGGLASTVKFTGKPGQTITFLTID